MLGVQTRVFVGVSVASASVGIDHVRLAAEVNSLHTTWWAEPASEGATRAYGLLGEDIDLPMSTLMVDESMIPDEFDAREQWPQCASVIGRIRDQSKCGSCWAFGSTESFNDRYCIATGDNSTIFSPWDTAACAPANGCAGGQIGVAWKWFEETGVVTGGDPADIGKGTTCEPYQFETCWHHVKSDKYPKCPDMDYPSPQCSASCTESDYETPYAQDKHRATSSYMISGEQQMKSEIMTYGPITVGIQVYANFEVYKGGVYDGPDATAFLAGHAVKVLGWGTCAGEQCKNRFLCHAISGSVTDGWCIQNCLMQFTKYCPETLCKCDDQKLAGAEAVPYWLVANSWNDDFGEKGFFRIRRGSNTCNVEGGQASAGHVAGAKVVV